MAVKSPCIEDCRIDRQSKLCRGCFRTIEEIQSWLKMSDHARRDLLRECQRRAAKLAAKP